MKNREIVEAALSAKTIDDARNVHELIRAAIGERADERPLGDRWNNMALLSSSGSFDHRLIENVTNMQDAVIERLALAQFKDIADVPYANPHEAATELLAKVDAKAFAHNATVTFYNSGLADKKRITVVFRDGGCGMTPAYVPKSIFHLGAAHKNERVWLQGAFGLGGATTFRNAEAAVLVTRRAPELLEGELDQIAVAVVLWQQNSKTAGAYYLTTPPEAGRLPLAIPAADCPEFAPGTYLALISYGVEGYHRARLGDEKSFDTVVNTRLFRPVIPIQFRNLTSSGRADRTEYLQGLARRFEQNPRADRLEGSEVLPFRLGGNTYHLQVTYYVFAKSGEKGERRKFVAHNHAVIFTSNGQAHKTWSPAEFRSRSSLRKLHDRILVHVETDELPIEVRSSIFTPDRSEIVPTSTALRLDKQVGNFIDSWEELRDIDNELLRQSIAREGVVRSTIGIARRIGRYFAAKGVSSRGTKGKNGDPIRPKTPKKPIELYPNPTTLEGPSRVSALAGETKFVSYTINAKDGFIPERASLVVNCTHPIISEKDITVGHLRNGIVRVSVAVDEDADLGAYELNVRLGDWIRSSGGLGKEMVCKTILEIVDEKPKRRQAQGGASAGSEVAVLWIDGRDEGWDRSIPGGVQYYPANILAEKLPDYKEYAALGDREITTVLLNNEYSPLKDYVAARASKLAESGLEDNRDRYAVGTGLGLLILEKIAKRRAEENQPEDEDLVRSAKQAVAQAVLAVMPEFDLVMRETGLE